VVKDGKYSKDKRKLSASLTISVAPGLACDEHSSVGKSCVTRRKYDDEYIQLGFRPAYAVNQDCLELSA
jgi:hypothetical protein